MSVVPGQINLDNAGGRALFELVQKDTSIRNIIDIGSWNGLGTTLCCVLGAISRPAFQPVSIISLETNTEFYNFAVKAWEQRPGKEMIQFINGRLATTMLPEEEIKRHPTFIKDHFDLWYESDKSYFQQAPKINLQGTADLVIIDGGEYCGFSDYEQSLLLKPTYLYLDDIRTQKTDKVLEHALANDYDLLFKDDSRNGFAVLRRNGASSNLMAVR
jgi:hypothetical protein